MKLKLAILMQSVLFASCGSIWFSAGHYSDYGDTELREPILTKEQYDELASTHPRPYIVRISDSTKAVTLFGTTHTYDPNDAQLDSIRVECQRLRPTVALIESRLGFLFRWFSDPVKKFGESGFVYDYAQENGIPCYTWEPLFEDEIAWTLKKYPQKRVALFFILRPYFGQVKFKRPDDPDEMVEGTIGRRTKIKGLEGSIGSIAEIDSIWKADFSDQKDWRDTDDRYGWVGYLNDMAVESNAFRDEHFARVIIDLTRKGERVFAVCGSSHAVKLENALRATVKQD
jgi:hypothetical protein